MQNYLFKKLKWVFIMLKTDCLCEERLVFKSCLSPFAEPCFIFLFQIITDKMWYLINLNDQFIYGIVNDVSLAPLLIHYPDITYCLL